MEKIVVITGPTATGKSRLAVMLARQFGGEIVSADSMQVYRGLDIGTAKIRPEETLGVPHHMLDVCDPKQNYSAARYVADADECVREILSRGKLPLVCGGTGLYIDSLVSGRGFEGGEPSQALRRELNAQYDELGGQALLKKLAQVDPDRAAKLHPSDKKRLVRALEVYAATGRTISEHDALSRAVPPRYDAATIVLSFRDRQKLYERIDARVDAMFKLGLVEEVRALLASGVAEASTAMQAIGYRQLASAFRGEMSLNEAKEAVKRESRRYAKRQLTWLRAKSDVFWIFFDEEPDFEFARQVSAEFLHSRGLK
ncbi:MAG: tRNA (adenosine(37)-N6)-dimethylallyltransferase MiaA [Oscillospiraceae bacterium]|jgi:tRNA dimethylallyltransferase|nr:tRNA (adenosine(37)-N6)-dimethylallyltransferase MiaA [Oscillospiraceae bacterium]